MTDETTSQALVNYEEQLKKELAALSTTVEAPSSNKINTKGKVFSLPNGVTGPGPIQAIILDYIAINQFYPGVYNAKVKVPPACWALGRDLKKLTPSTNVEEPMSVTCDVCPKNQWGSSATGSGKACKNQRRLLVIPPDFNAETDEPMTLYVSPTGLKSWNKYITKDLGAEMGALPIQVVTEIGFNPNETYPTLTFKYVGKHTRLAEAMSIRAKYQDILLREPEVKDAA